MKFSEVANEPIEKHYVLLKQKEEIILGRGTLGAQDSVVPIENRFVELETSVEIVLENDALLYTLGDQKKYIEGRRKLAPIVLEVVDEWTHQGVTYHVIESALKKVDHMKNEFLVENDPSDGSKKC